MNLPKLFAMQKVLDERIEKEHPTAKGENRLQKKILALLVELGECCNEWRGFKFWSKNQQPNTVAKVECASCIGTGDINAEANMQMLMEGHDGYPYEECDVCNGTGKLANKNPLLEEYVDCLHFFLSIGIEKKQTHPHIYSFKRGYEKQKSVTDSFLSVFELTRELDLPLGDYDLAFSRFLELGKLLGFTWEQIEQAYISKNEVNHERQTNGY